MQSCLNLFGRDDFVISKLPPKGYSNSSKHVPLNDQAIRAYTNIVRLLPGSLPVILESPILPGYDQKEKLEHEINLASGIFSNRNAEIA